MKNVKRINFILIVICTLLVLVFGVCVILALYKDDFKMIDYISVTSSFAIALLTVIYVYASTRQMRIMEEQLSEMKEEHSLIDKPLVLASDIQFRIEHPRFFYSPPEQKYSFLARYFLKLTLVNTSNSPAISVCVKARLIMINKENDVKALDSFNKNMILLEHIQEETVEFMFPDDSRGLLLDSIRNGSEVMIEVKAFYKNTIKTCFETTQAFRIDRALIRFGEDGIKQYEVIKDWHSSLAQAEVRYKESLHVLRNHIKEHGQPLGHTKYFDNISKDFSKQMKNDEDIEIKPVQIDKQFDYKTITSEEYLIDIKDLALESLLEKTKIECFH